MSDGALPALVCGAIAIAAGAWLIWIARRIAARELLLRRIGQLRALDVRRPRARRPRWSLPLGVAQKK